MSMEEVVAQIRSLNDQNIALQMRLEQAEQEVIRQRGAIEQSAQVVAAVSLGEADSMPQTLQVMGKRVLEDAKRLSKSLLFNNNKQDFVKWSRETANYMNSVHKGLKTVLACAVDEEEVLDWKKFKESHFDEDEAELEEMNEQVYQCLKNLTEGESFDMVLSAGEGQGLEAWRRLNRRWDPIATGCSEKLWESIQSLGKSRVEDLMSLIERLEDLLRRYLIRRKTEGDVAVLDEDTKMASLESLLPKEMEQHVQLNKAKLTNYFLLRAEIMKEIKRYKPPEDGSEVGLEVMETDNKSRGKGQGYWTKGTGKGKGSKGKGKGKEVKGKYKGYEVSSLSLIHI